MLIIWSSRLRLKECVENLKNWKTGLQKWELKVTIAKTKFMVSGVGLEKLKDSGKLPVLSVAKEWGPTPSTVLFAKTGCMPNAAD